MTNTKFRYFLLVIFSLALFLRLFRLSESPPSINWDEAAFAYNAYSILETGRDEYGTPYPLEFKSVGDYKCPLYIYLLVPVIRLFGLNVFSIRLVPALFGSLTVIGFALFLEQLSKNRSLALLAALFLAASPWHLQFTRNQGDVAISSFLVIWGLYAFFRFIAGAARWLPVSAVLFGLTFYAYFAERFFTPLLLLLLGIVYFRILVKSKRLLLLSIITGLLVLLPLGHSLFSAGHQQKILLTTIFSYQPPETEKAQPLFHSRPVELAIMLLNRFVNHFTPSFLFFTGPPDQRQLITGMGMMYLFDAIFIVIAIVSSGKPFDNKNRLFFIGWLIISPLPAVITRDPVHARRAFNLLYPLITLSAWGALVYWQKIKQMPYPKRYLTNLIMVLISGWSIGYYLLSYHIITPLRTYRGSAGWQYGYRQLVAAVSPLKTKYSTIVIDNSYQGPYLFFLFYEKYPPALYQPQAKLVRQDSGSLGESSGYDNYEFREVYWPRDRGLTNTLFAAPPDRIVLSDIDPKSARLIDTIYFPDGKPAFYLVETIKLQ